MKAVSVLLVGLFVLALGLTRGEVVRGGPDEEPDIRSRGTPPAPPEAIAYPGIRSVVDAVRRDDSWYVLDASRSRVHRLRAGEPVESFAVGAGGSEGAVRPQVVLAHADTLVVIERRGGRVYLHAPDGTFLGHRRLSIPGCPNPGIFDAVSRPQGIVTLATCPGRRLNTRAFATLETVAGGSHILLATASRPRPDAEVDPYFTPVLVAHPEGIAFGNARSECLAVVDMEGALVDSLCHTGLERLATPEREQAAVARARIAARALGARLGPTETLPPFDRAWPARSGGYVYRAPTRAGPHTRALVSADGRALPDRAVPPASRVFAAPDEVLYGWLSGEEVRLARYRLPG